MELEKNGPRAPVQGAAGNVESSPIILPALMTSRQVADLLQVTERTVYTLRQRGLRCILIGGAVRFDPADVARFIDEKRTSAPDSAHTPTGNCGFTGDSCDSESPGVTNRPQEGGTP